MESDIDFATKFKVFYGWVSYLSALSASWQSSTTWCAFFLFLSTGGWFICVHLQRVCFGVLLPVEKCPDNTTFSPVNEIPYEALLFCPITDSMFMFSALCKLCFPNYAYFLHYIKCGDIFNLKFKTPIFHGIHSFHQFLSIT